MKKKVWIGFLLLVLLTGAGLLLFYSVLNGFILLNNPSPRKYPVRGVDVSHYQGEIDWQVLSKQGIDFAYIKATEGSSFVDPRFLENWEKARQTDLKVGAYHFFSFDSQADTQLLHVIATVPSFEQMMPLVVDFEFYGDKQVNPPPAQPVREQLTILLEGIEAQYGKKPVIYATEQAYEQYLKGFYQDYDLWIRNVIKKPDLEDRNWTFWQYTNRERLKGYQGEERFIDMNVFYGDRQQWNDWLSP